MKAAGDLIKDILEQSHLQKDWAVTIPLDQLEQAEADAEELRAAAGPDRVDLAAGRRHRDHEHHAGDGDRADAGDRHPPGPRRQAAGHRVPVPDRGDRADVDRRAARASWAGSAIVYGVPLWRRLAGRLGTTHPGGAGSGADGDLVRGGRGGRRAVRAVPGLAGGASWIRSRRCGTSRMGSPRHDATGSRELDRMDRIDGSDVGQSNLFILSDSPSRWLCAVVVNRPHTFGSHPFSYSRVQNAIASLSSRMCPFFGSHVSARPVRWAMLPRWHSSVLLCPSSISLLSFAPLADRRRGSCRGARSSPSSRPGPSSISLPFGSWIV